MMRSVPRLAFVAAAFFVAGMLFLAADSWSRAFPPASASVSTHAADAPKQVVWGFLQAQKIGDIGGAAVACTSLSLDYWKRLGFVDNKGQINPTRCMYAFIAPLVSSFTIGKAALTGGAWKIYAVVNGVSVVFSVKKVDGNWKIVNIVRASCEKGCN